MKSDEQQTARQGMFLAITAYTIWGIAPIYFKLISAASPLEILSHRIVWSFFLLAALIHIGRRWHSVVQVLRSKRTMLCLLATALLVGGNWLLFIWAINANHILDASLGYYINPLLNVLLGMIFLGERLRKMQWFAVTLATCGVLVQLIAFGSVPIIAIALALSFGFYGLIRKKINLDAQTGLFIETLLLFPIAALYLLATTDSPTTMSANPWSLNLLLIAAGAITTLPLLCFTGAATRLKLSTLGFFQYIGPSLMFLLAVLIYGEAFALDKAITFAFIWGALITFSIDGLKANRHARTIAASR